MHGETVKLTTWAFKVKTEQDVSVCYNVNQQMYTLHWNYSNVLIYTLSHVSRLTGPSSGSAVVHFCIQMRTPWQWASDVQNMGVCVLKHYCNSNAVCAICWSYCTNCIIMQWMENVKDI